MTTPLFYRGHMLMVNVMQFREDAKLATAFADHVAYILVAYVQAAVITLAKIAGDAAASPALLCAGARVRKSPITPRPAELE